MPDIDKKFVGALSDDYMKGVEAARNNVPRWKRPEYYSEKSRTAWEAGYDAELSGARPTPEVRPNMPEATATADIVALQAATLLNNDEVSLVALSENAKSFRIRGVTLEWDAEVRLRVLHPVNSSCSPTLGYSYVSPPFREVFFEAAQNWHQRRRDELCAPAVKRIANPEPPPAPPLEQVQPVRRRRWF